MSRNTTLLDKVKLATKGEPEKTLITKGVMNMDGSFTDAGWTLFKAFLVEKFGNDFVESHVSKIPEDKKSD